MANDVWKTFFIIILSLYMYGAICLKYVSGAESFEEGVSFTFWDNSHDFDDWLPFEAYHLGLIVFGVLSTYFSFGNIENAKTL